MLLLATMMLVSAMQLLVQYVLSCTAAVNATLSRTTADAIEGEDVEVCVTIPSPACENIVFNFSFAGTASGKCSLRTVCINTDFLNFADSDYTASNTMNISMGDNQACITIRTMEDGMDEPNESLIITWQPTTLSYVGFDGGNQVTVTIRQRKFASYTLISKSVFSRFTYKMNVRLFSAPQDQMSLLYSQHTHLMRAATCRLCL